MGGVCQPDREGILTMPDPTDYDDLLVSDDELPETTPEDDGSSQ